MQALQSGSELAAGFSLLREGQGLEPAFSVLPGPDEAAQEETDRHLEAGEDARLGPEATRALEHACPTDLHEAVKADPIRWRQETVYAGHYTRGGVRLAEARNCLACGSSLARRFR